MSGAKSSTAIATTVTGSCQSAASTPYRGRFAPSPTGPLHYGSLYAAAASYLDARATGGRWLLRIEDLDAPRAIAGMASEHLATLERFGFEWDEPPTYQSQRLRYYADALDQLQRSGLLYDCSCSRTELGDSERYPGYCRNGALRPDGATAQRVRVTPGRIDFVDRIQGAYVQDPSAVVGDFVVCRRDHRIAYQLAVVVDDALQGISEVVRGADLLDNTPRQIYLQRVLSLPTPRYAHVPVLVEQAGEKLAKSRRSLALDGLEPRAALIRVFMLLGLQPPAHFQTDPLEKCWKWAISQWVAAKVPKTPTLRITP